MSFSRLFFFDSETGGFSAITSDLVEVAAVLTDITGKEIIEEFSAKVFPKLPVSAGAARVNGYTREKWAAEAVDLDTVMPKLMEMSRGGLFCAHNSSFDFSFFEKAMKDRFMSWGNNDYHKIDTVAMAMPLYVAGKVQNLKLSTLAKYFGVPHEHAHQALEDVRACRGVYLKLMEIYGPPVAALP